MWFPTRTPVSSGVRVQTDRAFLTKRSRGRAPGGRAGASRAAGTVHVSNS